jgi:hypothetical protein
MSLLLPPVSENIDGDARVHRKVCYQPPHCQQQIKTQEDSEKSIKESRFHGHSLPFGYRTNKMCAKSYGVVIICPSLKGAEKIVKKTKHDVNHVKLYLKMVNALKKYAKVS